MMGGGVGVELDRCLLCPMSVLVLVQSVLEGIHCCRGNYFMGPLSGSEFQVLSVNYSNTKIILSLKYAFGRNNSEYNYTKGATELSLLNIIIFYTIGTTELKKVMEDKDLEYTSQTMLIDLR